MPGRHTLLTVSQASIHEPAIVTNNRALSDEEVVARVRAGERELFELIMRRHNQRLFRVARAIVRADDAAEDVLQQAYLAAFTHLDQFAGQARFATWLTRITIHAALASIRHDKRRAEVDLDKGETEMSDLAGHARTPEALAADHETAQLLEAAVDDLPEPYRLVFMMREVQQLSVAETAACLEISDENVKVRLHRAKGMLRAALLLRVESTAAQAFPFMGARCDRVVGNVLAKLRDLPR
jgi:RNA polymerase sigma-70 factor (ECF subfamily)